MNFIRRHKIEIGIFLLALLLRLAYLSISIETQQGVILNAIVGADNYFLLSQNLLAGHGFSSVGQAPYLPNSYRPPLWPFFMAGIYQIFGSYLTVVIIEIILASLLPLIAMRISEFIFDSMAVVLTTGIFLAIEPYSILFSTIFYSETFFMVLFSLSILWLFKYFKSDDLSYLALSSCFLGLATLTKPTTEYLPIFITLAIIWNQRKNLRKGVAHAVLYASIFLLTLSPWATRNYALFGIPSISSSANVQVYEMLVPSTLAIENDTSWGYEYNKLLENGTGIVDVNKTNIRDTNDYLTRAVPILMGHKAAFVALSANTTMNFFIHDGMYDVLRHIGMAPNSSLRKPALFLLLFSPKELFSEITKRIFRPDVLILIGRICWTVIFLAFLYGIWKYKNNYGVNIYFLNSIIIVTYFMLTTLSIGLAVNARYRLPVNLFLIMFASYAFFEIRKLKKTEA